MSKKRYEKIKPGHPSYERVQALLKAGHSACDGLYHNAAEGCNNPSCWKHPGRQLKSWVVYMFSQMLLSTLSKRETLRSLSKKTGVPFTTLGDWARGESIPPLDQAETVAKVLGWKLVWKKRTAP